MQPSEVRKRNLYIEGRERVVSQGFLNIPPRKYPRRLLKSVAVESHAKLSPSNDTHVPYIRIALITSHDIKDFIFKTPTGHIYKTATHKLAIPNDMRIFKLRRRGLKPKYRGLCVANIIPHSRSHFLYIVYDVCNDQFFTRILSLFTGITLWP